MPKDMLKFDREEVANWIRLGILARYGVVVPLTQIEPVEKTGLYPGEWWVPATAIPKDVGEGTI